MVDIYLQPVGFVSDAGLAGDLLPLAGGPHFFSGGLIFERVSRGLLRRRYVTARDLMDIRTDELRNLVEKLTVARPATRLGSMHRPLIMGIVNVTPDSFSDGGHFATTDNAVAHARRLIQEGADIIDIGGESSRPGADTLVADVERDRVMPVLQALRNDRILLSLDTRKASIMVESLTLGVDIINDISTLTYDACSVASLADRSCMIVLMHSRGASTNRTEKENYENVVFDVYDELEACIRAAESAGINRDRLIVDPGIGFGKTIVENLQLMQCIALFHGFGVPLMLGVSRKATIGSVTGVSVPRERISGSLGMGLFGVSQGVQILRVHDVLATRHALSGWLSSLDGTIVSAV